MYWEEAAGAVQLWQGTGVISRAQLLLKFKSNSHPALGSKCCGTAVYSEPWFIPHAAMLLTDAAAERD